MKSKLQLNKETLRELTESELSEAKGGERITTVVNTQSVVCPSGATWFQECGSVQVTCG